MPVYTLGRIGMPESPAKPTGLATQQEPKSQALNPNTACLLAPGRDSGGIDRVLARSPVEVGEEASFSTSPKEWAHRACDAQNTPGRHSHRV